jgi:predicted nucleic acid-binding Zn ribbon protein
LARELGLESGLRLERMRARWDTIFGEPMALHAYPISLSEGELLIGVDSPVWLQELSFRKAALVEKLSEFGVSAIRLKQRPLPGKAYKVRRP